MIKLVRIRLYKNIIMVTNECAVTDLKTTSLWHTYTAGVNGLWRRERVKL